MKKSSSLKIDLASIIREETIGEVGIAEHLFPAREPSLSQYIKEGLDCYRNKNYDRAAECFKKALKLNPKKAEVHYNLGLTYQAKKMWNEAIDQYQKALELNPEDAEAHNNLGIVYYNKGEYRKAIEEFKLALCIDPGFKMARKNLRLLEEGG